MGAEGKPCTIDLEAKRIDSSQVERAEELANLVVRENREVKVSYVTADEARALGVRKLPPEQREKLRLIDIRDFDLTACGGTHVRATGEIGSILLRRLENVKQGVRVEFVCGSRAVTSARRDFVALSQTAGMLSVHPAEVAQQATKLMDEAKAAAKRSEELLEELAGLHAAKLLAETAAGAEGVRVVVQVFAERDAGFVRLLAQKITRAGNAVALLAGTAGQPAMVFAQTPGLPHDMGALMKQATAVLGARGGGTRDFAQGGAAHAEKIASQLEEVAARLRG
jgi:alanyl-tRNA synthetase